jgi:type I restriction enzyme S subunit
MSWPTYALDDLGEVSRGRSRHRPRNAEHLYGGPFPFVQTGDVKAAPLYLTEFTQTYSDAGLAQSKLWPAGTLCITIAANIAETCILGIDACFPDSIIGFVPDPSKTDTKFIKYQFDAVMREQMKRVSQGVAQDNLSQEKLLSFRFPVPNLPTQQRIAGILSAYDDLIENNRRRIGLLEQAARLLYHEWFVHLRFPGHETAKIVDGLPEGWRVQTYGDLFNFLGGYAFQSSTYLPDGRYGIVTIKNVHDAAFYADCSSRVMDAPNNMKPHCRLQTSDILLSLTGNVGRACVVVGENLFLNQRVAKIEGRDGISRAFTYWSFSNPDTMKELENLAYGVAQLNLSPVQLSSRPFVRPAQSVIAMFEGATNPMLEEQIKLVKQNAQLTRARDLLLPRLMDGRIPV